MSSSKKGNHGSPISQVTKSLVVAVFKLLAIAVSFTCRVVAMVLNGISELLQKATDNGNH